MKKPIQFYPGNDPKGGNREPAQGRSVIDLGGGKKGESGGKKGEGGSGGGKKGGGDKGDKKGEGGKGSANNKEVREPKEPGNKEPKGKEIAGRDFVSDKAKEAVKEIIDLNTPPIGKPSLVQLQSIIRQLRTMKATAKRADAKYYQKYIDKYTKLLPKEKPTTKPAAKKPAQSTKKGGNDFGGRF